MQPEIAIPLVLHCGKGSRKIWRQSIRFGLTIVVFACLFAAVSPSRAENAGVTGQRRSTERLNFSDNEIAEGFLAVAFGAELQFGKRAERIRKFDGPIRVFVEDRSGRGRGAEVGAA